MSALTAREACELAALPTTAELAALAAWPLPKLTGTTVTDCLDLGEGAAIVHDGAGTAVVPTFDPEAAVPAVLATYDELHAQVDDGMKPSRVAQLLVLRERGALLALRAHVGRVRKVAA